MGGRLPGGNSDTGTPGSGIYATAGGTGVYGGTFSAGTTQIPTSTYDIYDNGGGITIYGSNFKIDGTPVTQSGDAPIGFGELTVLLEDNTSPSTITYYNTGVANSVIFLDVVPEPTSLCSLWVLAALVISRRRFH